MNSGPLLFLGLFATMAVSWLSFVMGPELQIGHLAQTNTVVVGDASPQAYPLAEPGDAHQGEEVYRANGCAACHTQMVRPLELGSDTRRGWGARRSLAEDYLYERPVMLGTVRIGPDLANYGRRSDLNGILLRLYDPNSIIRGSVMPPYRYLFEKRKIQSFPSRDALVLPEQIAPPAGYEIIPRPQALALAAYLMGLRQEGYLFEAPPPPARPTNAAALLRTNVPAK
ncbi:MAG: cbb3-type cytochrome c oxidase subunit II [Limisphaerales bacterium]